MKKLLTFMLALVLCLGLALPAAAYDVGTVGSPTTFFADLGATAAIDPDGTLWAWGTENSHLTDEWYMGGTANPMDLMENVASGMVRCGHGGKTRSDSWA